MSARPFPPATRDELVAWFIVNACPDHHIRGGPGHLRALHTARRILERHPEVARADLSTAVVCGDLAEVRRILAERPAAANEGCGPKGATALEQALPVPDPTIGAEPKWTPLLYLCFTRLATSAVSENAVAIARELLDRDADPNVYFMAGDSRYTPLVGVAGEGEESRP